MLSLTLARALPLAEVETALTLEPVMGPRRAPMLVELFRDSETIIVAGSFPGPEPRADLLIALGRAFPDARVADLSGIEAGGQAVAWGAAVAVSVAALGEVRKAFVRLESGRVAVTGVAVSEASRQRLDKMLNAVAGPSLVMSTTLNVPRRPIVPFETVIVTDATGRVALLRCAARDDAEARLFEHAIAGVGGAAETGRCKAGVGGPDMDWGAAVMAGLSALQGLPGARFALSGTLARLEGTTEAAFDAVSFEAALSRLAATLPAGFALDARLAPETLDLSGPTIVESPWLVIERDSQRVRLAGQVATAELATALQTIAARAVGRVGVDVSALRVSDSTTAGAQAPGPDMGQSAIAALGAMTDAPLEGRAVVAPGRVAVTATLTRGREAAAMQRRIAAGLPPGVKLSTLLTVDLPAAVDDLPLPPEACAAALNRAVLSRPIGFAPGSVQLDPAAQRTVVRLARVLRRCEGARIEVGGHTDNQGRASMNRRLSRARAEAVRAALAEIGQDPRRVRLSAHGYGEDEPVADNKTEAGRALNRRIAFRAITETPQAYAPVVGGE